MRYEVEERRGKLIVLDSVSKISTFVVLKPILFGKLIAINIATF